MGQSLSGLGASSKPSSHDKAVFELKRQRDNLRKYQRQLDAIITLETGIAKKCLANGDKRRALLALRKKKYQEQMLEKSEKQLFTLEEMASSIEYKMLEAAVMDGIKQGNAALTDLNKELSIEKVEKLMEETADAIAYQNEIDEMLGTKLSEDDEADVLAELEAIEAEKLLELQQGLPTVPSHPLPEQEQPIAEASAAKPVKSAPARQANAPMPA
ncbi:SNF7 family protein [Blastocladiella britannica]|nr:SNF7 family protein [Blastocladiella britannica]